MKKFNLKDDEYIIKNTIYGELNDVSGEFVITNENIIFTSETGVINKTNIVKKIPFSSIKNPKGHLQAFYNEEEERVDLYCKDTQYEIIFDDFDCDKFIDMLKENINGSKDSEDNKSNEIKDLKKEKVNQTETENKIPKNNEYNDVEVSKKESNITSENVKNGFATFAGIAKNMAIASTNYIKDASEKYLKNSQTNNSVNQNNKLNNQVDEIDKLKIVLSKLKEMLNEELITQEEYDIKRNEILGKNEKEETIVEKVIDIAKGKPKVKKCPSCGEILGTFDTKCPLCGYELHNIDNSVAMNEFQEGLNRIERMRNHQNEVNAFGINFGFNRGNNDVETTKVEYIRNYVVPRTKEDLVEFMVLAKSNVEPKLYTKGVFSGFHGCNSLTEYNQKKNLSDAWFSMMQQIFDKSKIIFDDDDSTYKKIEKMYVDIYNKIM